LGYGEEVGALRGAEAGLDLCDVVDEEAGDGDLGADVAELGGDAPEEGVLVAEGLVDVAGGGFGLFGLGGDVCVCDFGDAGGELAGKLRWGEGGLRSEEEHDRQEEDEASDAEIHPLYALQTVVVHVLEQNERSEDRRHNTTDSLEGLRKVETKLHPSGRTTSSLSHQYRFHQADQLE
jgi:hypothetical protein